ncbi:MAG TPA: coproporphyrinogen-III oxidase family protein, partial [Elusimicrobiota bacterium]|nr:coproporphyrinogen-III oxidase family protein [Elusimicrobiota bacterium]
MAGQGSQTGRYLSALEREAELYPDVRPDTLYVGGGTPSELSAVELARLLAWVGRRFGSVAALREATVEGNPESLGDDKLDALRAGGVGRLSLGLQASQDRLLKSLGRRHSFADFARVYRNARARGFDVSVDLMFGLPGQSRADARASLDEVLALEPEHLSLYSLQVEDRTLFGKREVEVDEDLARAVMEESIDALAAAGYRHYEISNFAKPGKESVHNLNYWADGEYLGLGCGAAGRLGAERWQNEDRLT